METVRNSVFSWHDPCSIGFFDKDWMMLSISAFLRLLPSVFVALIFSACAIEWAGDSREERLAQRVYSDKEADSCSDDFIAHHVADDTIDVGDGRSFYHDADCDSIRFLFAYPEGTRVIDRFPMDLVGLHYRLGYQMVEEFDDHVLFRYGCAAMGPCDHALHRKSDGAEVVRIGELVTCIKEPGQQKLVYFPEPSDPDEICDSIEVYDVDDATAEPFALPPAIVDCSGSCHLPEQRCIDSVAIEGARVRVLSEGVWVEAG